MDLPSLSDPAYQPFWTAVAAIATCAAAIFALGSAAVAAGAVRSSGRTTKLIFLLQLERESGDRQQAWFNRNHAAVTLRDLSFEESAERHRILQNALPIIDLQTELGRPTLPVEQWLLIDCYFAHIAVSRQSSIMHLRPETRKKLVLAQNRYFDWLNEGRLDHKRREAGDVPLFSVK